MCFHCVESYSSIYRICLPSYAFVGVFCSTLLWVAWLIHSGAVRTDDREEKEAFPLTLSRWRKSFAPKLENLPTFLPFAVLMTAAVLVQRNKFIFPVSPSISSKSVNTLRTGDADLRFYITTVQDGWGKSAFLTCACFPCTIHLIIQFIEPVSEWFCWRMFIETWPHSELMFRHRASSI